MYIERNMEACFYNQCCTEEAASITDSAFVSVALGIQQATRTRHIVICGLSGSTIFSHVFSQTVRFSKRKSYWTKNVCFYCLYSFVWKKNLILRRN